MKTKPIFAALKIGTGIKILIGGCYNNNYSAG